MSGKTVASNRRARHDYEILDTFEAGLSLLGSEVKSIRAGQVSLADSYATVSGGEVWLEGAHIAPYKFARDGGHDPVRRRKLLMHRGEIDRLTGRLAARGLTLIPLRLYFKDGKVKVELGLAKGRRTIDKRRAIRDREQKREMDRAARRRI